MKYPSTDRAIAADHEPPAALAAFADRVFAFQRRDPEFIAADYYWLRKRQFLRRAIRALRAHLPPDPLAVEFGPGEGRDAVVLLDELPSAARYVGVEADPAAAGIAGARLAAFGLGGRAAIRSGDVTKRFEFDDRSIDLVYCSEVLEHLPDATPTIAEMARVLRPGGFLIVTTPNEPNVFQASFYSRRRRDRVMAMHASLTAHAPDGTPLYHHVGLKTTRAWDRLMGQHRLALFLAGRGAVWYGGRPFQQAPLVFGLQLVLEGVFDLLPIGLGRMLSDHHLAVYRADA